MMLDNEETLFRPGDDRVASLFMWHFVEEVEHRSSALVIYDAVVGKLVPDAGAAPRSSSTARCDGDHRRRRQRACAGGGSQGRRAHAAAHVRHAAGAETAESLRRANARRRDAERLRQACRASSGWSPWRVLLSQTPFHNPGPRTVARIRRPVVRRWDRGDDVTRWYTAETRRLTRWRTVQRDIRRDRSDARRFHLPARAGVRAPAQPVALIELDPAGARTDDGDRRGAGPW